MSETRETEYHVPILVPERHVETVEVFLADLKELERFARDPDPDRLD